MIKSAVLRFCYAACAILLLTSPGWASPIEEKDFGTLSNGIGRVHQFILTNKQGSSARLIDYGATLTNLFVPDKNGKMGDVVLGFDDAKQYEMGGSYMGCIPGRYANRIANGLFTIDGTQFAVTMNLGTNCLHGGFKGLAQRMWDADTGMTPDGPTVRFTILDPDGAEGFPGNVKVTVLYSLSDDNVLKIQYFATTDKPTPINLTNHSYFNLNGGDGNVLNYVAKFNATQYLLVDSALIPTGQAAAVAGTPFDFTKAKLIGRDIKSLPGNASGYDNTMVLDNLKGNFIEAAQVYDPNSGRLLECWTTEPSVQFYTANGLSAAGKSGKAYGSYSGFCLETQHYPDSPNHPNFPSTILRPGQVYRQLTEFKFSIPAVPMQPER
jgi:aldose 1-epimerase